MARGTWSESNIPRIPGFYNRMQQKAQESAESIAGVYSMPVKSDWGPIKKVTSINSLKVLKNTFGENKELTAYKLGKLALLGKPKELLLYRLADSSAAKGSLMLVNTEAEPASVIKLETLYESARKFRISVTTNITNTSNKDITLFEESTQLAIVENVANDLDTIVEAINGSDMCDYIVASKIEGATGTIDNVTTLDFTGGNNGTDNITVKDYMSAMKAFQAEDINGFSLDGVADKEIIASTIEWVNTCREEGVNVLYFSSTNADSITIANSISKTYNNLAVHNGFATSLKYDGITYTAAEAMVYVGALALSKNLKESICNEVTIFEDVEPKLTRTQLTTALEAGTIVFTMSDGKVVILDDVNTYKNYDIEEDEVLGNIRAVRFIDTVNNETSLKGEKEYVGKISNDDTGHTIILCGIKTFFDAWKSLGIISGYEVVTDEELQKNAKSYQYFWKWSADYVNVTKQIFGTGNLVG